MTDNEIIQALECCSTYKGKCTDCPAFVKVDRSNCKQVLLGAIEIINRQKAEINRFKKRIDFLIESAYDIGRKVAVKEFAERLKTKGTPVTGGKGFEGVYVMCSNNVIDDLVKEMVGADK